MIDQIKLLGRGFFIPQADNRGQERLRRAGLTGITAMVTQSVTIATGLISVPLSVGYLGEERYGVWLTMNSLLLWLYPSSMGLSGNALINTLSEANGKDDRRLAQELVATAFWSLTGLTLIFSLLFLISFSFVNWTSVFNTSEAISSGELHLAVVFGFIGFIMLFPTSMVDAVYQSHQEGFIGNAWNIAGSIVSLLALIIVTKSQGGLPLLVAVLFGARLLFSWVNAAYLFFHRRPWLMPTPKAVTKESFRRLMRLGVSYLIAQLSSISLTHSQPMIITQILGPTSVAVFSITQRIMFLPTTLIQMFTFPLMPAYAEAKARCDITWIRKTLKFSFFLSVLATLLSMIVLIFTAHPIISFWVGRDLLPSRSLVYAFAAHAFIGNLITPVSVMLYGMEKVKAQAVITTLGAVAFVPLGILLTAHLGETGLVLAMIISLVLTNVTGLLLLLRSTLRNELRLESPTSP